jgi:hypothetical protein
MALVDAEWKTAYTALATELSATAGSSTGTQVEIDVKDEIGIEFRLSTVTLTGAASKINIGLDEGDGGSTTVWKTANRRNGSRVRWPVVSTGDGTAPYPVRSAYIRVVPYLDVADSTAACLIQYRRIGPNRI